MSQIQISHLTFSYEGSYQNIFENVSFSIDTDWKLGFIGRNGKGKTTFLQLLMKQHEYIGTILCSVSFDYFPYQIKSCWMCENTIDVIDHLSPVYEYWKLCRELSLLQADMNILYRPYQTLSHGERTKVMLALLFSTDDYHNYFHLIDEPTNHLDTDTRKTVAKYLTSKSGFILVSHDRTLLDQCIDHILVLNRTSIEVGNGNFSSWWENKQKKDAYEQVQNTKLKREINKLKESSQRSSEWATKIEQSKIGFNPTNEHDRFLDTRAYIGEKSRRMQQRVKSLKRRQDKDIEEKKDLLLDIEENKTLILTTLEHPKNRYLYINHLSLGYKQSDPLITDLTLEINSGDRIALQGKNGSGKSSLIKAVKALPNVTIVNQSTIEPMSNDLIMNGDMEAASNLIISYINQDTSHLHGSLNQYIELLGVSDHLFKSILRQLDFDSTQFDKDIANYSQGQKKKLLIAGSILQPAHLFIWDEPLNYIDIFSRMQLEELILTYKPTMLFAEHDETFCKNIATQFIKL